MAKYTAICRTCWACGWSEVSQDDADADLAQRCVCGVATGTND